MKKTKTVNPEETKTAETIETADKATEQGFDALLGQLEALAKPRNTALTSLLGDAEDVIELLRGIDDKLSRIEVSAKTTADCEAAQLAQVFAKLKKPSIWSRFSPAAWLKRFSSWREARRQQARKERLEALQKALDETASEAVGTQGANA